MIDSHSLGGGTGGPSGSNVGVVSSGFISGPPKMNQIPGGMGGGMGFGGGGGMGGGGGGIVGGGMGGGGMGGGGMGGGGGGVVGAGMGMGGGMGVGSGMSGGPGNMGGFGGGAPGGMGVGGMSIGGVSMNFGAMGGGGGGGGGGVVGMPVGGGGMPAGAANNPGGGMSIGVGNVGGGMGIGGNVGVGIGGGGVAANLVNGPNMSSTQMIPSTSSQILPISTAPSTGAGQDIKTPVSAGATSAEVNAEPEKIELTQEEWSKIESLSSLDHGFLELKTPADVETFHLIFKAIGFLERALNAYIGGIVKSESPDTEETSSSSTAAAHPPPPQPMTDSRLVQLIKLRGGFDTGIILYLGHLNLLIDDYHKALSAYQLFYRVEAVDSHWKDCSFLYGLASTYFHFGAHRWSVRLYQSILYLEPSFPRVKEIHFRLGILYKFLDDFQSSMKHFRLSIPPSGEAGGGGGGEVKSASASMSVSKKTKSTTFSDMDVQFHIGHLLETQEKPKAAKEAYEGLLVACGKLPPPAGTAAPPAPLPGVLETVKSNSLRHLGWLFQTSDQLKPPPNMQQSNNPMEPPPLDPRTQRTAAAIDCLRQSIQTEENSGQSWYFLGRCYASLGKVHDAFVAYRHSIDKSEASADTWCSIGVLYQQQNQPMDALQAYICAVQLDKSHVAAWTDLAVLYESCGQPRDALTCYINAANSTMAPPEVPGSAFTKSFRKSGGGSGSTGIVQRHFNAAPPSEALKQRIKFLEAELNKVKALIHQHHPSKMKTLPSIEEAWTLPIPAELTSRQQQLAQQQQQEQLFQRDDFNKGLVLMAGEDPDGPMGSKRRRLNGELNGTGREIKGSASQCAAMFAILQRSKDSLTEKQKQILIKLELRKEKSIGVTNPQPHQPMLGGGGGGPSGGPNNGPMMGPTRSNVIGMPQRPPPPPYPGPPASNTGASNSANPQVKSNPSETSTLKKEVEEGKDASENDGKSELLSPSADFKLPWPRNERKRKYPNNLKDDSKSIVAAAKKQLTKDAEFSLWRHRIWLTESPLGAPPKEPPPPFPPLPREKLSPTVQTVTLTSKKDANAVSLQGVCTSQPITILKGLASALKLDLGLFSTKNLVEQNALVPIEMRLQRKQKSDDNYDPTGRFRVWRCESEKAKSNIAKYAQYQAASFQESLQEETTNGANESGKDDVESSPGKKSRKRREAEKPAKIIKTGRCEISPGDRRWRMQLAEIQKVPQFLRVVSASNILSHLGSHIVGVNTIQLQMTVPGSRKPAGQEENNLSYVNLNVGPGELEWFGVEEQYWGALKTLCEKHNVNYLTGPWWPVLEELMDNDIPVYRFQQSPGDLVWVNSGTIFWAQSVGWCNSISWNLGTLSSLQYNLALERYEYSKFSSVKSKLPMITLSWNLAANLRISDNKLWELIRLVLMRSLYHNTLWVENLKTVRGKNESEIFKPFGPSLLKDSSTPFCVDCEVEMFNIFFAKEDSGNSATKVDKKYKFYCVDCANRMSKESSGTTTSSSSSSSVKVESTPAKNNSFSDFILFQQFSSEKLVDIFDNFNLNVSSSMMPPPIPPSSPSLTHMGVGTMTSPMAASNNYSHPSMSPNSGGSNSSYQQLSSSSSSSMDFSSKMRPQQPQHSQQQHHHQSHNNQQHHSHHHPHHHHHPSHQQSSSLSASSLSHSPGPSAFGASGVKSSFSSSAFHHSLKSVGPNLASQSLKERLVQETLKSAISNSPNLAKQGLHPSGGPGGGGGGHGSGFGQQSLKSSLAGGASHNSMIQQSIKTEIGPAKIGGNSLSSSMAMLTTESKIHHNRHHSSSGNNE